MAAAAPVPVDADLGAVLRVIDLPGAVPEPDPAIVLVGVCRRGPLPEAPDACDVLLTLEDGAPRPWVTAADLDDAVARIRAAIAANPIAAAVLTQVMRMRSSLAFADALVIESLAYSALLGGGEFRAWRAGRPVRPRGDLDGPRVRLEREDGALAVTLVRPAARNAVDAAMRDALAEALQFAIDDPDQAPVLLRGEGPAFSAGGDLDEFGEATDLGAAHAIRIAQSPARLLHVLGRRASVRVHGACIGAGIEVPAGAARVVAALDAFFRLPEVGMGLIPGAGGTATIPPRIGRQRTAWMALTGADVDAETALAWGLVDAVEPSP
jgi:enoyl-CoA hydratase/carnithine racemase